MQKIGFCERYNLTTAVLNGTKTMTRRVEKGLENLEEGNFCYSKHDNAILLYGEKGSVIETIKTRYKLGEVVAVAQAYKDIFHPLDWVSREIYEKCKGWSNKLFVRPDLMPHRIQITGVRIERLQDISDEDCLKEGIIQSVDGVNMFTFDGWIKNGYQQYSYTTPREAFAALINRPGVGRKGLWESNPFVVVYEFKLVK